MISRITNPLPVKLTIMSLILTLINLRVLVDSLVLMRRRGEAKRHHRVGATVAIELRRLNGGVGLMVRGRCAMLAVYVRFYAVLGIIEF